MSVLHLQKISKSVSPRWGERKKLLENVSLTLEKGEVFALLGPNGSGKTTLTKIILSLFHADEGLVEVFGTSPNDIAVRKKLSYMPEQPEFPLFLNASEVLHLVANLYDIPKHEISDRVAAALRKVILEKEALTKVQKFSKGMKKRLALAQIILAEGTFLILDEPLDGLDPEGIALFRQMVLSWKQEGKTVLLTSHLLPEIVKLADRVGLMREGSLIYQGALQEILKTENLEQFYLKQIQTK